MRPRPSRRTAETGSPNGPSSSSGRRRGARPSPVRTAPSSAGARRRIARARPRGAIRAFRGPGSACREHASAGHGPFEASRAVRRSGDGTLMLAKTAFAATDPNGVAVSGTTNFEFSNVGGPIEIVAPEQGAPLGSVGPEDVPADRAAGGPGGRIDLEEAGTAVGPAVGPGRMHGAAPHAPYRAGASHEGRCGCT